MRVAKLGKVIRAACLVSAFFLSVGFLARGARAEVVDRVLATIDGEPLTLWELREYAAVIKATAGPSIDESSPRFWPGMLEAMITERIVRKEAAKLGLSASEKEIDRYVKQIRQRNNLTEEELKSALVAQGLTWDKYREKVQFDIERSKLLAHEIGEKVTVSPEEIERYYESNREAYRLPEQVRLWHIYIPGGGSAAERERARERARRCLESARKGEDFGKLAREYSLGPGAAEGGDIGEIARGQMLEELEEVAFELDRGEISDVIETEDGFHILKAGEHKDSGYRPLAEVSDEIRGKLYDELLEERYRRWLAKDLRSRHHVEMLSSVEGMEGR